MSALNEVKKTDPDMPKGQFHLGSQPFSIPVYNKTFERALIKALNDNKVNFTRYVVHEAYYCYYTIVPGTVGVLSNVFAQIGQDFERALKNDKD